MTIVVVHFMKPVTSKLSNFTFMVQMMEKSNNSTECFYSVPKRSYLLDVYRFGIVGIIAGMEKSNILRFLYRFVMKVKKRTLKRITICKQ